MIFEVIEILAQQVEEYTGKDVTLGNIALADSSPPPSGVGDAIVLTLVNMNEENTMKNYVNNQNLGGLVLKKNPVLNLNLYLLFSVNKNVYKSALKDLSKIVEFFQGKKVFTQSNSTYNHLSAELAGIDNFKFHVELYTPSFEELNYIWGSLGGKQYPSALYKLSAIQVESEEVLNQSGTIESTDQNLNNI